MVCCQVKHLRSGKRDNAKSFPRTVTGLIAILLSSVRADFVLPRRGPYQSVFSCGSVHGKPLSRVICKHEILPGLSHRTCSRSGFEMQLPQR